MAVPPEAVSLFDHSVSAIAVGMLVHLLVLDGAPQSLYQDVVVVPLPS
jgi:hypothetical protein